MPRRRLLTPAERAGLLAFPAAEEDLVRHFSLSEADLSVIGQRRGAHNRLGLAVQLCVLRYPGFVLPADAQPPSAMLAFIGRQLDIDPDLWKLYGERAQTRREHLTELQARLGLTIFGLGDYRRAVHQLAELARQTDRGIVLAEALVERLRQAQILVPRLDVIERVCAQALVRGSRWVYSALTDPLADWHRRALDALLVPREATKGSGLVWLRQPPGPPKPKHILTHLERLATVRDLGLPDGLERAVHQNRLLKLAREGAAMTAQHLRDLDPLRRYATLVAILLDTRATLIDEILDLHERFLGALFGQAKRRHAERFQASGKAINDKVRLYSRIGRALLEAREQGGDPFVAIETVLP